MDTNTLVLSVATLSWSDILPAVKAPEVWSYIQSLGVHAESRRALADYDTGSITEDEAYALMVLASHLFARVVIEVGTFIGFSSTALSSAACVEALYTCDASNNCLKRDGVIHPYPKNTSTAMLTDLANRGIVADLCFFDGVLSPADAELLRQVTHAKTVYAFHDYTYGPKIRHKHGTTYYETMPRKGIGNVTLLTPHLPSHVLIEPFQGSTLALLVPEAV